MDYSQFMSQGAPMSSGVANAMQSDGGAAGAPSLANPGGSDNQSYQTVLQAFSKVDAGIRALRMIVLQSMPASGKCANQLDKLAYELGKIKADCERDYADQQADQIAQQAVQSLQQY